MKLWKVLVPAGVIAGAAAYAVIRGKSGKEAAPAPKAAPAAKTPAVKNAETGVYSFVSGFRDPKPVDIGFTYDRDKFSFDIISEDFPIPTSDSHAILMECEEFSMQMEYAGLYNGQDFAALQAESAEKYPGFAPVQYGSVSGFTYIAGDNMVVCLPVDGESYLFITMIKAKGNDDDFTLMPTYPHAAAVFGSMQVK